MIKAVAIDIDGTLTDAGRRLDLDAVSRLRELEDLGVKVILATGNILCIAEAISIMIGTSGPLIAENGGVIMDPKSGKTSYRGNIDLVKKAFQHLMGIYKVQKVSRSELRKTEIAIYRDIEVGRVKEALNDFPVSIVDTKFAIHIKDAEVNKGTALVKVAEMMNIKLRDIVAIGDSENDREMLQVAGYAISVGEGLRDVSDYTTKEKLGKGGREALDVVLRMKRDEDENEKRKQ
ncbi:MAG: phosphoglycolate phosphatase [Candidatus Hydrothermarchaeales archaeon]